MLTLNTLSDSLRASVMRTCVWPRAHGLPSSKIQINDEYFISSSDRLFSEKARCVHVEVAGPSALYKDSISTVAQAKINGQRSFQEDPPKSLGMLTRKGRSPEISWDVDT